MNEDCVFILTEGEWRVRLNGTVLPHTWNTRGAALAGLKTERQRIEARQKRTGKK